MSVLGGFTILIQISGAPQASEGADSFSLTPSFQDQTKQLPPAADHSPTVDELMKMGFPAPDRLWLPEDLGKAVAVCRKLLEEDIEKLPRQDSKASGVAFNRLTSRENLEPALSAKYPLEGRGPMLIQWMGQVGGLMKVYVEAMMKGKAFDAEVTEIFSLQIVLWVPMMEFADHVMKGIKPTDPSRETRLAGIEQMKHGMSTGLAGLLTSIGDKSGYSTKHRLRMIRALRPELPKMMKYLPTFSQKEVPARLEAMTKDEADLEVKRALADLSDSVR